MTTDHNFKPGGKVVAIVPIASGLSLEVGKEYEVVYGFSPQHPCNDNRITISINGYNYWVDKAAVKKVGPSSPIQTRTVKELVPGVYGRVSIGESNKEDAFVRIQLASREGKVWENDSIHAITAQELRAAADVFKTLADYLEGKE